MPRRVSPRLADRVRMLLATGHTGSQVVRRTGLSRSTVFRIAAQGRRLLTAADIHDDSPAGYDREALARCPGCGNQVYLWPCLQCELRKRADERDQTRQAVRQFQSRRAG